MKDKRWISFARVSNEGQIDNTLTFETEGGTTVRIRLPDLGVPGEEDTDADEA